MLVSHSVGLLDDSQPVGHPGLAGGDGLAVASAVGAFGQVLAGPLDLADMRFSCGRKMSGKWNNGQAYYPCRYPAEYALANRVSHPKNVYLKEADVLGHVDDWLAELFDPEGIAATVSQLTEQAGRLEDLAA